MRRCLAMLRLVAVGSVILLLVLPAGIGAARSDPVATCQKAIGKAGAALVQATIRAEQVCLDRLARGRLPQGTQCVGHGPSVAAISDTKTRSKILQAASKTRIAIERSCASVDLLAPPPDGIGFPAECPTFEPACAFVVGGFGSALDCLQCTHVSAAHYLVGVEYAGKAGETATPTRTPTPTLSGPTRTPTPTVVTSGSVTVTITPTPVAAACPSAISFEADATTSVLDAGWTGFGHDSKVIDKGKITVGVTSCASSTRPCGVCNLQGPIPNPDAGNGTSNNQRCTGDTSIECTADATCAAAVAGTCAFFFGGPFPLAAGGVATCVTNRVVGAIAGTADIETGANASSVSLTSTVFSAGDQSEPCPVCRNDATPEDGTRSGTCSAGLRAGMPCDVSAESPTFGKTSFDCPPEKLAQLAELPINLANSTGTATRTLFPDSPRCGATGFTTASCMCDTCATAAAEPCGTNADCPAGRVCGGKRCVGGAHDGTPCSRTSECGSGFCTVPGAASKPNDCDSDATCTPTSDSSRGECRPGPFNQYCAPHDSFRGCTNNTDCKFPGDTCTGGKFRPCYLDNGVDGGSVTVAGTPDPPVGGIAHPTLGALFCIGSTGGSAVDTAAGLPGLGRIRLLGTITEIP